MQYKLPIRKKDSHKGECGKVLVVAGNSRYYGAPILAALGAELSGTDLVSLVLPLAHIETAKKYSLNFFLHTFKKDKLTLEDVDLILNLAKENQSLVIGPGLGGDAETQEAILEILSNSSIPTVIDAQALFPKILEIPQKEKWVVTPHKQEFCRLFNSDATVANICSMSRKYKLHMVVKGHVDIVSDSRGNIVENKTGCPEMRVGGTGDVLSGVIGSWVAQGLSLYDASNSALFYYCLSAEDLQKTSRCFSAYDLIKFFPLFMSKIR
ncbi:MAG: NAD(P)H-hydrate dehydratase [Rickettsiales bacterium]|nr:NAD(P)H-hydrate dehydratase [Rickettsiales bacterium]